MGKYEKKGKKKPKKPRKKNNKNHLGFIARMELKRERKIKQKLSKITR